MHKYLIQTVSSAWSSKYKQKQRFA
uniref:Uncharacterized protein n=1 Tax=Arundo donax TaxID=35708 RepID=A0A0A9AFC4_ARUDO